MKLVSLHSCATVSTVVLGYFYHPIRLPMTIQSPLSPPHPLQFQAHPDLVSVSTDLPSLQSIKQMESCNIYCFVLGFFHLPNFLRFIQLLHIKMVFLFYC
jgi:hypothetical protein